MVQNVGLDQWRACAKCRPEPVAFRCKMSAWASGVQVQDVGLDQWRAGFCN